MVGHLQANVGFSGNSKNGFQALKPELFKYCFQNTKLHPSEQRDQTFIPVPYPSSAKICVISVVSVLFRALSWKRTNLLELISEFNNR
ncbi:MAG TPA: hypothetical protein DEP53_08615 [Bacteroidetes bacterium]|nr:hypothetical protein [Bacteroidota bacterium]